MFVRINWGKIRPSTWDAFEGAYVETVDPNIPGLLARWLVRDTMDVDTFFVITAWNHLEAIRVWEGSASYRKAMNSVQPFLLGEFAASVSELRYGMTTDGLERVIEPLKLAASVPARAKQSVAKGAKPLIVGVGGARRLDSSAEKALRLALAAAKESGADIELFSGADLMLPMYEPGNQDRTSEASALISAFRRCDGLIISSPAYHGSISGLLKNTLDYAEDLKSDSRLYFDGVAVGCIVCAGGWQAAGQTLAALRAITHALRGWPTPLGAMLNTSTKLFDDSGQCTDLSSKFQLEEIGRQVVEFALMRREMKATETANGI